MRTQLVQIAGIAVAGLALVIGGQTPIVASAQVAPSPTATSTPSDVTVDLGASTGTFRGGAAGSLYGLYDQGVPSNNLIEGMGLQSTDTKAQDGQQHPGSDALEVAKPFVDSGGKDVYIYMTDVYRNFPYERTSYAQYQQYMTTEVTQVLASPYKDHIVLIPYNEPDGNWFGGMTTSATTLAAFNAEWLQTYTLIKGLWPQARIAGPNLSWYYPSAYSGFLSFCKANGCLPDVITWHELGVPSTVRTHVEAYRALETSVGLASHLPVNLNEYAANHQLTNPGQMVPWLSAIEDEKVDGDLPYWNINGSLSDSAAQQNVPNAQWWLYNWYSSMTGNTVQVAPAKGNPDNTMQGVATLDPTKKQARIVLGGGPDGPANVEVKNVDRAVFGAVVHATVEQDRWSGMSGAAAQPTRILDADVPLSKDGSLTLPVSDAAPASADPHCTATGPRAAGKLAGALNLCGNNEYASLPAGIVSSLNDFTVSAWVNPAANSSWSRVFDFGTGTTANMFLTLNADGHLRFAITASSGGGEQQITDAGALPLNTWSHVAVTVSGNTGTLYVDGQPVATNTAMTVHPSSLGSTTQNWIGRSQYSDPYLNAMVDDFQIYDRGLSQTEVAALAGGQQGAGNVASYRFDEAGGAIAVDSSGNGRDATIVSTPEVAPSMSAYQVILSPGGTGAATPTDSTWTGTYEAENATITGSGWSINTEGTSSNLYGMATSHNQDVGGLRTGSSTDIAFHVAVPQDGDYDLSTFAGSYAHAPDVSGPTNIFVRVDGSDPREVFLPVGFGWTIWNHADMGVHLSAGAHTISLSTAGANGATTNGDAIIDKIDLRLNKPAGQRSTVYEAEQATLDGATADYGRHGQSGAGVVDLKPGQSTTFWVDSATDGYSDLALRSAGNGTAGVTVNGLPVEIQANGSPGRQSTSAARVYLSAGVNKVVVRSRRGTVALDKLTVTPLTSTDPATSHVVTYQAEGGTLTGTASVDNGFSQADGAVVKGVGDGPANSVTLTVKALSAGAYAMTMRYANDQELTATHYNPDVMTQQADISVNGAPSTHVNFANTYSWNQFWNLTVPVTLQRGTNTLTFTASQPVNFDGHTVGIITTGSSGVGAGLRSSSAPNLDQVSLAPFQLRSDR